MLLQSFSHPLRDLPPRRAKKKGAKTYILAPAVFLPCLDHAALLLARQLLVISLTKAILPSSITAFRNPKEWGVHSRDWC